MRITYEKAGALTIIEFDAVIRETHSSSSTVTSHPVETGSDISDHVRPGQDRFSVEARVSNTPLQQPSSQMRGVTSVVQAAQLQMGTRGTGGDQAPSVSASVLQFSEPFDRVRDVYDELKAIEAAGTLVAIETLYRGGIRDYENMAISSLTIPRTAADGSAATFSFDATGMRIVSTEKVTTPSATKTKKKNRGPKGKTEVDKTKEPQKEALLHRVLEKLIDLGAQ